MAETEALVVCVPNFSEGRRPDVIDAICDALAAGDARLVARQADPEHNRLDTTIGARRTRCAPARSRARPRPSS